MRASQAEATAAGGSVSATLQTRATPRRPIEISVVIPVYGCSLSLRPLHERLTAVLSNLGQPYEIVFVDDRGEDGSWEALSELAASDPCVVVCRLSRNFGQHIAITAGLARCRGAYAVVMDCDLQDPPEFIPHLYEAARDGNAIVLTRRQARYQSAFRHTANRTFFRMLGWMARRSFDGEFGSFSLISRPVIDAFLRFRERDRHYLMILGWLGFTNTVVSYERDMRHSGRSGYTLRRLVAHALSGMVFSTTRLLRWVIYVGLVLAAFGMALAVAYVIRYFTVGAAPGWTSLIVVQLILGGIVTMSVGVTGLYIGKIFEAVQQRPLYVVEEERDGAVEAAPQVRHSAVARLP
ncbi:MAG: glycosyltransferase family 2 protein [Alphaproteobacteria bacterium]|nr:glycosyltransferase family 2 protein [Alphaproteobacteria bacterium]